MWKFHDQEIQNLKKQYDKASKQTQLRLQEIFDGIDFDFEKLYNIADSKTKRKINTYIESWKDKEILEGYFGMLAKNIYSKTRVKNSEILELLIYSAYIEEQKQLDETEQNTFKKVINYYYQEGQKEVDVTKKSSIIPEIVLATILSMPNAKGYIWKDYKEGITKYNAEQIYRQATIDLQQQKNLDITNDIYQNIIKRQSNSKLNINGNKISGDVDLTLIGMNNKAKIEGIYSFDKNAEVEFIAVEDEVTTKMCHSLNGQRFKVHDWNEFKRYSKANDSIVNYKCYGLVTGLNLPPIDDGFHWCRSSIKYVKPVEKQEKTSYNNTYPEFKKEKLYSSGERHYSKKEIKIIANKMYEVGNKYTDNKSKWSGNIIMSNRKANAKLWNCNIEIESTTSPHAILHEQLHAHSISYYDVDTYKKYKRIEEASTELLTKEICKKENLVNITSAYDDWVECLTKINEKIKIENNTFEFAKTLYKIPVVDRLDFLDNKIQNYLVDKSINEAIELNNLLGELYV